MGSLLIPLLQISTPVHGSAEHPGLELEAKPAVPVSFKGILGAPRVGVPQQEATPAHGRVLFSLPSQSLKQAADWVGLRPRPVCLPQP